MSVSGSSDINEINMDGEDLKQEVEEGDDSDDLINRTEENIMKILIATDIHLGYEQTTKRVQDDDSFRTFEEILQTAVKKNVDLILLGGDLFHEAKPPHKVVMKCVNLLRKYCLSDKPVKIQFLSDPTEIFGHCDHKVINYEDPNLNVGIPVFSINGNHDDPSYGAVGSMDVLSATGLINYFGKWTDVTQVTIPPLLLRKGLTTTALYGLGYMNDQRLSRLMSRHKFNMLIPKQISPFNIFVLHQNRAQHSPNGFIPEDKFPDFINLVVWGHEHECKIEQAPEEVVDTDGHVMYRIIQPGSPVATSLAQGESVQKQIGILNIYKQNFKFDPIVLKTVRPFVFDDLFLSDHKDEISKYKSRSEAVEEFVDSYIEDVMIADAARQQTGHPQQPERPLLRLRVFYSEDQDLFNTLRISQKYYNVVANPNDIIIFRKCSPKLKKKDFLARNEQTSAELAEIAEIFRFDDADRDWRRTIQGGMTEYFNHDNNKNKLTVLSLAGLNEALSRFVNSNDSKSFHDLVKHQMKRTVKHLMKDDPNYKNKEEILGAIKEYRDSRLPIDKEEKTEGENVADTRDSAVADVSKDNFTSREEEDSDSKNEEVPPPTKTRGRGRGRGRGTATTKVKESPAKTTRGGRVAKKNITALDVTTSGGGNQTLLSSWRASSRTQGTKPKPIVIDDSDSD